METGKSGHFRELSLPLLNDCCASVSSLDGALTAVTFSDDAGSEVVVAGIRRADRLLLADTVPADSTTAPAELAEEEKPWTILAASMIFAKGRLPQAVARPNIGSTSDCIGFALGTQEDCLVQTRFILGESASCDAVCINRRSQIRTVRPGGGQKRQRNDTASVQVICSMLPAGGSACIQVLGLLREFSSDGTDLEGAEMIVPGGKGVGGPEDFVPLHELVTALGGAVGTSRITVDRGRISKVYQVGQTGHTVVPKLYITCGIPGTIRHLTGTLSSGTIVVINTDPDTRIFRYADYCAVEDLLEVVLALAREIPFHRG